MPTDKGPAKDAGAGMVPQEDAGAGTSTSIAFSAATTAKPPTAGPTGDGPWPPTAGPWPPIRGITLNVYVGLFL